MANGNAGVSANAGSGGTRKATTSAQSSGQAPREAVPPSTATVPTSASAQTIATGERKEIQRSTGMVFKKESDEKFAAKLKHSDSEKLERFKRFCFEVDGRAPDNDELLVNALNALYSRAKGFSSWMKEQDVQSGKQLDEEVDEAFQNIMGTLPGSAQQPAAGATPRQ